MNREGKKCSQVQVLSFWWNMSEMRATFIKLGWFKLNLMCIPSIFSNAFLSLFSLSLSLSLSKFNFFSFFFIFFFIFLSPLHSRDQYYDTRVYQGQQGVTCVIDFAVSWASVWVLFRFCTEPYHETVICWTLVRFTFPDKVIVGSLLY